MAWAGHAILAWIDVGASVARQQAASGTGPTPLRPMSGGRVVLVAGPPGESGPSSVLGREGQEWPSVTQLTISESFNKPPEVSLSLEFNRTMGRAFLSTPALNLYNVLYVQALQTGVTSDVRRQTRLFKTLLNQPPSVTSSPDGISISIKSAGVGLKSLQSYVHRTFPGQSRREILTSLTKDAGYDGVDFSAVDGSQIRVGAALVNLSGPLALLDVKPPSTQATKKAKAVEGSFYVEGGTRTVGAFMIAVASDAQCYLTTGVGKNGDELLLVRPLELDAAVLSGSRIFMEEPGAVIPNPLEVGRTYPMSNFQTSNGLYWLPGLAVDRAWKDFLATTGEAASGTSIRREAVTEDDARDRRGLDTPAPSKKVKPAPTTAGFKSVEAASQSLSSAPQGMGLEASWESLAVPDLGLGEKVSVKTISPRFDSPGGYLVTGFEHTISDSDWTTKIEASAFGMPNVSPDGPVPGRSVASLTLVPTDGKLIVPRAV